MISFFQFKAVSKIYKDEGRRSFTLIELLVVISIIGLLASVVLASVSSTRQRATFAAGQQFDTELYRFMGDRAAAIFTFDKGGTGSGLQLLSEDSSMQAQNLVPFSSAGVSVNTSGCPKGNCITLANDSGIGKFVYFDLPSSAADSDMTVAFWFRSQGPGDSTNNYFNYDVVSNYYLGPTGNTANSYFFRVGIAPSSSQFKAYYRIRSLDASDVAHDYAGYGNSMGVLSDGSWHHLAVEFKLNSAPRKINIYIDGKLDRSNPVTYAVSIPTAPVFVGHRGYTRGNNSYDEVYIYSQALSAERIHDLYLAGLPSHPNIAENK